MSTIQSSVFNPLQKTSGDYQNTNPLCNKNCIKQTQQLSIATQAGKG